MILKNLFLHNFRNYQRQSICFSPRINVFCGENGQGKTNLLEAIALLSTGNSFRTNHLNELINDQKSFFYVEGQIEKNGINQSLSIHFDGKEKKIQYEGSFLRTRSSLLGVMPTIMHAPADINLLTGMPSLRRRFLNLHLAQHDPLYVFHLSRFFKTLKQRNFLLRQQKTTTLFSWDHQLAQSAFYIYKKRKELIEEIIPLVNSFLQKLSDDKEVISTRYHSSFPSSILTHEGYVEFLHKNRMKELQYKTTLFGPHRDDWSVFLNNKKIRSNASEGQKKTLVLAFRLAEWKHLKELREESLPLCLDDFSLYLDKTREEILKKELEKFDQVFMTTPREIQSTIPMQCFFIKGGTVFDL